MQAKLYEQYHDSNDKEDEAVCACEHVPRIQVSYSSLLIETFLTKFINYCFLTVIEDNCLTVSGQNLCLTVPGIRLLLKLQGYKEIKAGGIIVLFKLEHGILVSMDEYLLT